MLNCKTLIAATALIVSGGVSAISPEEAKKLGAELTPIGAERAANKEGTIPAYAGGLTEAPAGFKRGDTRRADPFAEEKPLFAIDAKNVAQYADKLSSGVKALIAKYPSFRVDVYATHRTAAVPKYVVDNTLKNATRAKTTEGGLALEGAYGGVPFPIPKTGNEAMWNHLLRFKGHAYYVKFNSVNVDASGKASLSTEGSTWQEYPYYDPTKTFETNAEDSYYKTKVNYTGPARRAGEALIVIDPLNPILKGRRAWQYLPGQRRVKLAPDIAFDTPNPVSSGMTTYDDTFIFNGSMERYDFKLVGKKELYIPYNAYKFIYHDNIFDLTTPNHLKADMVRWELHRVWVVEATLKPGKRHIYSKRTFYLDEDSWTAVTSDAYDARGQLYRSGFAFMAPSYDVPAPYGDVQTFYDFVAGTYSLQGLFGGYGVRYLGSPLPSREWSADSLAGTGIR